MVTVALLAVLRAILTELFRALSVSGGAGANQVASVIGFSPRSDRGWPSRRPHLRLSHGFT